MGWGKVGGDGDGDEVVWRGMEDRAGWGGSYMQNMQESVCDTCER